MSLPLIFEHGCILLLLPPKLQYTFLRHVLNIMSTLNQTSKNPILEMSISEKKIDKPEIQRF